MSVNERQILCILFSEFVKNSVSENFDETKITREDYCFFFQSWHETNPLTKICVVPKSDLSGIRNPAAYIKENSHMRRDDGN